MSEEPEDLKVIRCGPGYRTQMRQDIDKLIGNRSEKFVHWLSQLIDAMVESDATGRKAKDGLIVNEEEWQALRAAVPTKFALESPHSISPAVVQICRIPMRDPDEPADTPTAKWRLILEQEGRLRYYRALVYDQPVLVSGHPFDPEIVKGGIATVIEKALTTENASHGEIIMVLIDTISSLLCSPLQSTPEAHTLNRQIASGMRHRLAADLASVQLMRASQEGKNPDATDS